MSVFDRFIQKDAGRPKGEPSSSASHREVASLLSSSAREAKDTYPEDSRTIDRFASSLRSAYRDRYKLSLSGTMEPIKAEALFCLSEDRMSAYACLFQPENGGEGLTQEEFMSDLHYEGINFGILQDEISRAFKKGYFHIFRIATGTLPKAGEDGSVTEHYQRRKNVRLEAQSGDQVDFTQDMQLQPIRKGTVICSIKLPVPGTDGQDVTGEVTPAPQAVKAKAPRGRNTIVSLDGKALIARVDGLLFIEDDLFCIHEQKIIEGDLTEFQGPLEIQGNLYIGGDVDNGVDVKATGDIVINGRLGRGRVTSQNGTIRVQKGVFGAKGETYLSAAGQVQAPGLENAEVEAGASVIAESVLGSTIHCGGLVYAMTGRGMIANSRIWAGDSVLCQRIGNSAGGVTRISVGYPPHIPELWEKDKAELSQVQSTIDMLWKPIIGLKNKGTRITDNEQSVLDQLLVQRELYTKRREELMAELRAINTELDKKSRGRIRCDKVHPTLDIQIGRLSEKVITIEENLNIRAEDSRILLWK